jgi:membrane associated rhomboid family serine protease
MARSRGEVRRSQLRRSQNLRSVFVLLFLNVAFYLLEHQDPEKFASLFRFDWNAVLHGDVWRLVTWQFTQTGDGWLETLALFVTLLILYMMGSAIEEAWGTRHFASLFVLSTFASAGVAAWLGTPLLGSYFVFYTLLFVYAAMFPHHTLYLFGVIPVRVRLIALIAFAALLVGVFRGGAANIAALAGAAVGFVYFLMLRVRIVIVTTTQQAPPAVAVPRIDTTALHNAARFAAMKQAVASGLASEVERLIAQCDRDAVPNVNICPPADFKPDATDGYCIRCEGFAECSARHLRARLAPAAAISPATAAAPAAPPEPAPL